MATNRDWNQILQGVFDEAAGTLKIGVSASVSGVQEVLISHIDDSIKIGDGVSKFATLTTVGSKNGIDVNIIGGASSSGGGGDGAILDGVDGTIKATVTASKALKVDGSGVTQPVSGTFWQATQPISGSVSVSNLPVTQPVSGTFWQATQPVSGTFWQTTQPVSIATMPTTPVTGTFWQATQPVSIASSVAVTGSFFQATQPVSIASMPSTPVTGTFWQATQPVSIASMPSTPVTQAALTKGTQGANGVTTQDLKDAGRNQTNYFMVLPVVSTATDALMSLTGYKGGAAVAATTTPAVVTTAKTYRINKIVLNYVAIATAGTVKFTLRANTAGVVAITSPAVTNWIIGAAAAAAGVAQTVTLDIPDGIEFPAGTGVGVSMVGLGATQTAAAVGYGQISIQGFEY